MPKEAIERGGALKVLPLGRIAGEIQAYGRLSGEPRAALR